MSKVFEPIAIGGQTLKNRFVRSATWEGMCDKEGRVTDRLIDCYRTLAQGGAGLLITGYGVVRPDGIQLPGSMRVYEDAANPGLKALTDTAHAGGAKIFCQLVHVGNQASSKFIGTQPIAPSAIQDGTSPELPREMSPGEISEVVVAFASAAARCKACGFDGVQLHGAHGYLINHVAIKLTAADNLEGGFVLEEAVSAARRLEELGIDAIEVSSGTAAAGKMGPIRMKLDEPSKQGYNVESARVVKAAVGVPVITVGGIRTLALAEEILASGAADALSLSRPLIREPNLVNLWADDPSHSATCISCNGCFKPGLKEGGIRCILDPVSA